MNGNGLHLSGDVQSIRYLFHFLGLIYFIFLIWWAYKIKIVTSYITRLHTMLMIIIFATLAECIFESCFLYWVDVKGETGSKLQYSLTHISSLFTLVRSFTNRLFIMLVSSGYNVTLNENGIRKHIPYVLLICFMYGIALWTPLNIENMRYS